MTLTLNARVCARNVQLDLALKSGETIAVMGPNGAGKSTLIQLLSGVIKADSGRATLEGRTLFALDPGTEWLPPHERGVGVLAQEPLLFPHLNVLDNVAFGPRSRGQSRGQARETARHWLGEVDATGLAARLPAQLSGGQAQRIALARALATDPDLLLLDEPMAPLDIDTAPLMRSLLKRVLAGRRAIIVTHHILDALMLADRVLIMEGGRIVESGPASSVLAHPRSPFAASLAGLNVLRGTLHGSSLLMLDGGRVVGTPAVPAAVAGNGPVQAEATAAGLASFPPSSVAIFLTPPEGSPRNCFAVTVTELEPHGGHIRVRAGELAADVSAAAVAQLQLAPGREVFFVVKAAEVALYAG